MERKTITEVVGEFVDPNEKLHSRETTFDLCYNYFRKNRGHLTDDIEKSCCVLWSYLASWGMLRGSTLLLQKNPAYLIELVEFIDSKECDEIFFVDVDSYEEGGIEKIMKIYGKIEKILTCEKDDEDKKRIPTATLITKIMLGVFGCVPAYDYYFCEAFKVIKPRRRFNSNRLEKESLRAISEFYKENRVEIDKHHIDIAVVDIFNKACPTQYKYTKAKIIDMYGFSAGQAKARIEAAKRKAEKAAAKK